MTDQRIEGTATEIGGRIQTGLGTLTDNPNLELTGRLNQAKGKAEAFYGETIDRLDHMVDRVPADLQDPARSGLAFARRKPLLTTAIVAGLGLLLAGVGRRR